MELADAFNIGRFYDDLMNPEHNKRRSEKERKIVAVNFAAYMLQRELSAEEVRNVTIHAHTVIRELNLELESLNEAEMEIHFQRVIEVFHGRGK